ncbi:thiamine monophosphate kinase (AIR synthase) [Legionella beliardensis]|uniref:Thiamine-monophosphate kinase n=1 Tax=Legionella beliardensis TaxID=91822 RepID=A0A378I2Z8_9GAMM|nr:thiamine-phosphate kinase [Legionella beliardensis]STX29538.1 thiamine monophosphate kinase (AIR synthase) [Legionella beliardensis]
MNEFSLIDSFFKKGALSRKDVIFGIGDDAACLEVPVGHHLLVSTDTLVADVHFLSDWDPYAIAFKAVMVNVSDIAAMAAMPCWITLGLTLPTLDLPWLERFSAGLHAALKQYNIALIGGDTTKGPLSMTLTIHGLAPMGKVVRRTGARPGDEIWVSGELGAAAQAVKFLKQPNNLKLQGFSYLLQKLQFPMPRIDLVPLLQSFASAAIDISDGLSGDLGHICEESQVGACLDLASIPVHPLVKQYQGANAIDFALQGGDDYELCFTIPSGYHHAFSQTLEKHGLTCYQIGTIEAETGLRGFYGGQVKAISVDSYSHF